MTHSVSSVLASLRSAVLGISPSPATFRKRRFRPAGAKAQAHFEKIGRTWITGYNAALALPKLLDLSDALNSIDLGFRGLAFEGAAMEFTLLDRLPFRCVRRFGEFLHGLGEPPAYMVDIGAGWALARWPWLRFRIDSGIAPRDLPQHLAAAGNNVRKAISEADCP